MTLSQKIMPIRPMPVVVRFIDLSSLKWGLRTRTVEAQYLLVDGPYDSGIGPQHFHIFIREDRL